MRILVGGAWQWPWYEDACAEALRSFGHDVVRFSWHERFATNEHSGAGFLTSQRIAAVQRRLGFGSVVRRINDDLADCVLRYRPDALFLYRPTLVQERTLERIQKASPNTVIAEYCNDDPFSPGANPLLWRHLRRSMAEYDIHFVFRSRNIEDFESAGARRVHLLRGYYVPSLHHPVDSGSQDPRFVCDAAFAGHYERDWRIDALAELVATNADVRLYGGGWNRARAAERKRLGSLLPASSVVGEEYRQAVCGARIALCFLSSLNRDTYTTRSFEIPAMGVFLLSQYTPDLASLFEEGREIAFFRTQEELLTKVAYYLEHEDERQVIARNGRERVRGDGHDVVSRMREMMSVIETMS